MWGFGIQQSVGQGSLYQPGSAGFGTPRGIVYSGTEQRNNCHVWVSQHRLPPDVPHGNMEHIYGEGSETQTPGVKERENWNNFVVLFT